ncbi:MAG TPA: formylglycine-generating enzyme family protein [bacterium]|nr:formylglycine-generating enzyme family protein [bacterium]HQL61383.1 formylglycine-generating enzyme family protein [bacterium]
MHKGTRLRMIGILGLVVTMPVPTPAQNVSGSVGDPEHPAVFTVPLDLPAGAKPLEMVLIHAGTFLMGSPSDAKDRDPDEIQHQVTITKDFYIGKYELTQAQWQALMHSNPSKFGPKPNNPVEMVSWYDFARFCNELSRVQQLTPVYDESTWTANRSANGYRLPTEAEWEYACRAGTTTRFYWGDDLDGTQIVNYAWCWDNSHDGTKEVGLKAPNAWGLYDISGNVWEWCYDWDTPYPSKAVTDPVGEQPGDFRILRGGAWINAPRDCRSANRIRMLPHSQVGHRGMRLARTR